MPVRSNNTMLDFHVPTQLIAGEQSLDIIGSELTSMGILKPLWIVPDRHASAKRIGRTLRTASANKPRMTIAPDPEHRDSLLATGKLFRSGNHDAIVAFGGATEIRAGKLLSMLVCSHDDTEHASLESLVTSERQLDTVPLVIVPFGRCDGDECQGSLRIGNGIMETPSAMPRMAVVDPRLTLLTNKHDIAPMMCSVLLELFASIQKRQDPMMTSWVASALELSLQALALTLSPPRGVGVWDGITLSAIIAIHTSGTCAFNRGPSSVISLAQAMTVKGLATRHQAASAILPPLLELIRETAPGVYGEIKHMLYGRDPIQFTQDWIILSDPKGTDRILQLLCGDCHRLLSDPHHLKELSPLLSLMPNSGGGRE